MKRLLLLLVFLVGIIAKGFCFQEKLNVTNVSYPTNVDQFSLFEVSFSTIYTGNPYDPDSINIFAVFMGPNNCRDTVIAFYYEDYSFQFNETDSCEFALSNPSNNGWRVRYTPKYAGTWLFYIIAIHTVPGSIITPPINKESIIYRRFTCLPVEDANGFISLANNRYLKREIVKNYHIYVQQNYSKGKCLSFSFPSSIRNLQNHLMTNKYGDAVFVITKKVSP